MSLRIWLPLDGDLRNQGLDNGVPTNTGATINNSGKIGKCYEFNGSSRITVPLVNLSTFSTTNCSMCVWIKFPTLSSSNKQILNIGTSSGWGNIRFGILYKYSAAQVVTSISDGSSYVAYNCYANITENAWSHVAAVYSNRELKLYINGNLASTYATTYDISFTNVTSLGIGAAPNGNEAFTGCLNDVRIYDHALSAREIKEISKGLILHYPLNRGGFGSNNLLLNTGFKEISQQTSWNTAKNGTLVATNWNGYNSGVANASTVYHAHLKELDGEYVYEYIRTSDESWLGISQGGLQGRITSGKTYTFSWEQYCVSGSNYISGGLYYTKTGETSSGFHIGQYYGNTNRVLGKWQKFTYTFTAPSDGDYSKNMMWYIYGMTGGTGTLYMRRPKLEEGSVATPWIPSASDTLYSEMGLNGTTEYDCSGFGHNGTSIGTIKYSSTTPRYNVSSYFDGSSKIYRDSFNIGNVFSASCWVQFNSFTQLFAFQCGTNAAYTATQFGVHAGSNGTSYGVVINQQYTSITGLTSLTDWHHVAITFDGTTMKFYFNGELKGSSTITNEAYSGTRISLSSYYSERYSNCSESDFRVYATCLSADDILALYNTPVSIANNGVMMVQGELSEV